MSKAVISADALRRIKELPSEKVKDLAQAQNVKAHAALADMTSAPRVGGVLGPLGLLVENAIASYPVEEAVKVADASMSKATNTHSKEDYIRAYTDSALAVVAISEQDAANERDWQSYIMEPAHKYIIEPLKGVAVAVGETALDLTKQAASGLNQTILYAAIAYFAINALQKTVVKGR